MSNTVTPAATESGEVQAAQTQQGNQIIATLGDYKGQLIPIDDSITVYGANSVQFTMHKEDAETVELIDGVYYTYTATVHCSYGTHACERIPEVLAIELYSDRYIHKCDENAILYTYFTRRKFVIEEIERESIILLKKGTSEENGEYEYVRECTQVYADGFTYWVHDSEIEEYTHCVSNGRYYHDDDAAEAHGCIYDDVEDEWVTQDVYDSRYNEDGFSDDHNTRSYHHFPRRSRQDENHCGFSIGFEVEKEDREVKVEICADNLYDDFGWCKEQDGSIDTKSGFEAVSPVYSLFGKQLDLDLKNCDLQRLINADYNAESCGGHINISSDNFTKEELFEGISAFFPLLYSIYENRINGSYCAAKKKHKMADGRDKYSAIYIRENRVEIRIFPAIKNIDNLIWRRDLIRIMVKNINATELQVFKMMMNKKSKLYKHLNRVMTADKIHNKCVKFLEYSKAFNDKNIDGHGNNLLKIGK